MGGATITVFGSSPEGDLGQLHYGEVQVSELPPSAVVTTRSQLRARHLLAAITTKTVLIQAGLASRAVRTAEAAHALGRPVGVVLGAEGNPTGAGCHDFATRHGALVIGNIQDADLLR